MDKIKTRTHPRTPNRRKPKRRKPRLPPDYESELFELKHTTGEVMHSTNYIIKNDKYVGLLSLDGRVLTCGIGGKTSELTMDGVETERVTENKVPTVSVTFKSAAVRNEWMKRVEWDDFNGVLFAKKLSN